MLKEVLDTLCNETTLEGLPVVMYELGDMAKMFFYAMRYNEPTYKIEAKISLSDLIAQCILICEKEEWNFETVKTMGIERMIERVNRHRELGE